MCACKIKVCNTAIHHSVGSRSIPESYYRNLCHLKESQMFTGNI